MNERGNPPSATGEPGPQERRLFVVLGVLGVAALFFGFFQNLNTIRSPFRPKAVNETTNLGESGETIVQLSQRDTDADGLSDFDELYQYQTSPYLADSDSDGTSDQEEVFGGTNPNCATGQTCSPITAATTDLNVNATTNATGVVTNEAANTNGSGENATTGEFSLEDLRRTLRDAGAPATTIDSMSDEELLALYQEVIGGTPSEIATNTASLTNEGTNAVTNLSKTNQALDASTLQNLTSAQIREFLLLGGADADALNSIDDATLREIYEQALGEMPVNTNT